MKTKKIAVMFSGRGTNLENIIKKLHQKEFNGYRVEVAITITNSKTAYGIEISKNHNIESIVLSYKDFETKDDFDAKVVSILEKNSIDLTVLAGYMRILTKTFTNNVLSINIHPSLLPKYKGINAIERTYYSDDDIGGATVHYVTSELDSGDIIIQKSCKKEGSLDEFEASIHKIEYEIFPKAILKVLNLD
jgi:phosphoribosylglycinamide formyltransferase-1